MHLKTLGDRIVAEPDLHAVLRELDLRARRDEGLRTTIRAHDQGWRRSLVTLLTEGHLDGAVNRVVRPKTAAELIIAAVKGASLNPAAARSALDHLLRLLTYTGAQQAPPEPTE